VSEPSLISSHLSCVNEQQTLANACGHTTLQTSINHAGCDALDEYYARCVRQIMLSYSNCFEQEILVLVTF
jgi:hypothetical protein